MYSVSVWLFSLFLLAPIMLAATAPLTYVNYTLTMTSSSSLTLTNNTLLTQEQSLVSAPLFYDNNNTIQFLSVTLFYPLLYISNNTLLLSNDITVINEDYVPYVSYYSNILTCYMTLSSQPATITRCITSNPVTEVIITPTSLTDNFYPFSISASINATNGDDLNNNTLYYTPLFNDIISIMLHRILLNKDANNLINNINNSNDSRRQTNRIAVGFLWFFAAVCMFILLMVTAVWTSYVIPLYKYLKTSMMSILLFLFIYTFFTGLICAFTGLTGFLILLILGITYSIIMTIVYYYHRLRYRDSNARLFPAVLELQENKLSSALMNISNDNINNNNNNNNNNITDVSQPNNNNNNNDDVDLSKDNTTANTDNNNSNNTNIDNLPTLPVTKNNNNNNNLKWSKFPEQLCATQKWLIAGLSLGFLISLVVCCAIFGLWYVKNYYIWHRGEYDINGIINDGKYSTIEFIPQSLAKSVASVYVFDGWCNTLKLNNLFFSVSTEWCGPHYSTYLDNNQSRYNNIQTPFILRYNINMDLFLRNDYTLYTSVNDWFTRSIRLELRPIAALNDTTVVVSGSDCRLMVFQYVPPDQSVWIKENGFTLAQLIGGNYGNYFSGGSMALFRLAPQDYHRFHMPMTGTLMTMYNIEGSFHSVDSDAITSDNYAIYNQRTVMIFNTSAGFMAYVSIGALCIGSISINYVVGQTVIKGAELGYFSFGGSTNAIVWERNAIQFDSDLIWHSKNQVETLVQVGQHIGVTPGNIDYTLTS